MGWRVAHAYIIYLDHMLAHCLTLFCCTPCLKKLCKFVFVRTSSNLHQFW